MPKYVYKSRNSNGDLIKNTIEAADKNSTIVILNARGIMPTEIVSEDEENTSILDFDLTSLFIKISDDEYTALLLQLSTMIRAGVTVSDALQALRKNEKNPKMYGMLEKMHQTVLEGNSLSTAMQDFPDIFSTFTVSIVRTGEATGNIAKTLEKLAAMKKKANTLRQQLINSSIYPIFLLIVSIVVLLILTGFVLPAFSGMFRSSGRVMPLPTRMLMTVGDFVAAHITPIAIVLTLLGLLLTFYSLTQSGKNTLSELSLKVPVIGTATRIYFIVHISELLSLMLEAGIPLRQILINVIGTISVRTPKNTIEKMLIATEQGETISSSLENDPIFTNMAIKLIESGETTGNLDLMFSEIALYYDERLQNAIKRSTALIEPIMITGIAILVGFILLAIFLPMYEMIFMVPK